MSLPAPPHPHRLERLRAWMEDERLDAVACFGADHVTHLCGYARYFGGPSAIVVGGDGERTLVVMLDEARVARELSDADDVVGYGERGFGLDLNPAVKLAAAVASVPAVAAAKRLGLASELPGIEPLLAGETAAALISADAAMLRLRLVKDPDEVARIGASYELCWLAQQAVGEHASPGTQEIELYTAAQSVAQIASGAPIEFVCDLLSGPSTAEVCSPIHVAGTRRLEQGDPVVADIVVRSRGYWGDSAETHATDGHAEAAAARSELLEILHSAGALLVPGATGAEIHREVDTRIRSTFPGGEFPHHGGHALGLTSFEDPHLIPTDTLPFEPWMVLAVEPGVYFPGRFGARVENVFLVTDAGGVDLREALHA
jgi:Xaa-Pro dipeptidase